MDEGSKQVRTFYLLCLENIVPNLILVMPVLLIKGTNFFHLLSVYSLKAEYCREYWLAMWVLKQDSWVLVLLLPTTASLRSISWVIDSMYLERFPLLYKYCHHIIYEISYSLQDWIYDQTLFYCIYFQYLIKGPLLIFLSRFMKLSYPPSFRLLQELADWLS